MRSDSPCLFFIKAKASTVVPAERLVNISPENKDLGGANVGDAEWWYDPVSLAG